MEHAEDNLTREDLEKRLEWYQKKFGPYIEKRGTHNFKNLFRKPNIYEWTILAMMILVLGMFFVYSLDVQNSFQNGYNVCRYEIEQGLILDDHESFNGVYINFSIKEEPIMNFDPES